MKIKMKKFKGMISVSQIFLDGILYKLGNLTNDISIKINLKRKIQ